jgi:hypothetical protein
MANAPFPIQPALTAVAIRYGNSSYIADSVAPRLPVATQEFKYLKHVLADGFTLPDTRVGRKSQPNEVEFSATEETASTEDYGLEDPIPQADINNAPANYDPLARATEGVMDLIMLDREKRVADVIFAAGTYATANKTTLSGRAPKPSRDAVAGSSDPAPEAPLAQPPEAAPAQAPDAPADQVALRAVWTIEHDGVAYAAGAVLAVTPQIAAVLVARGAAVPV